MAEASVTKTLEFYFDVGSATAYLAHTQLPAVCGQTGAQLVCKPMLLGGVFQATGNQSPMAVAAKGRYISTEMDRFARRYQVPFSHNPHFPINTLMLMRGATGVQMHEPASLPDYLAAVFRAIWVDGKNMNEPPVVAGVLQAAGFDPMAVLAMTLQQDVKDRLKAVTQEAVARGVFGAPTFFVGDQMFWGQDRLEFVKEALQ